MKTILKSILYLFILNSIFAGISFLQGKNTIQRFMANSSNTEFSYDCEIPGDIPDTLATGEEIYWDCDWYASYKNKKVFLKWEDEADASKGVSYIGRYK